MLTKKDYVAIAEIIKNAKEDYQGGTPAELVLYTIDSQLADYFEKGNSLFNRQKFIIACSID